MRNLDSDRWTCNMQNARLSERISASHAQNTSCTGQSTCLTPAVGGSDLHTCRELSCRCGATTESPYFPGKTHHGRILNGYPRTKRHAMQRLEIRAVNKVRVDGQPRGPNKGTIQAGEFCDWISRKSFVRTVAGTCDWLGCRCQCRWRLGLLGPRLQTC